MNPHQKTKKVKNTLLGLELFANGANPSYALPID
jgi:hypothetical protein